MSSFSLLAFSVLAQAGSISGGAPPIAIVENVGQWPAAVPYGVPAARAVVLEDGVRVEVGDGSSGAVVQFTFEGAHLDLEATEPASAAHQPPVHFFFGRGDAAWRTETPSATQVTFRGAASGVFFVLRGEGAALEYDVCLEPGADLSSVTIRVDGVEQLSLGEDGSLQLSSSMGTLEQGVPITWVEDGAGKRRPIGCRYRLLSNNRYGFIAEDRSDGERLIIDPGLAYSTYLQAGAARSLIVDQNGGACICAEVGVLPLATTPGAYQPLFQGLLDAIIAKLSVDGSSLQWSTFLGGAGSDRPRAHCFDATGRIYVTGETNSFLNFPISPGAYDASFNGYSDAYVSKLSSQGSALIFSTFIGGDDLDQPRAIQVDSVGSAYITGVEYSTNYPTTPGAYASQFGNMFLSKFAANGSSLAYSIRYGGPGPQQPESLVLDSAGNASPVGITQSTSFPVTAGALSTSLGSPYDAFYCRFNSAGNALLYSTYIGGAATAGGTGGDWAMSICRDTEGYVYIGGTTGSFNFPVTPGAYKAQPTGPLTDDSNEGFVMKISPSDQIVWSTYLGGSGNEGAKAIDVDPRGAVYCTSATSSPDLPATPDAVQSFLKPTTDFQIMKIDPTGRGLVYCSYLGGSNIGVESWYAGGQDIGEDLAVDRNGDVYVSGRVLSSDFPTTPGAYQTTFPSVAWPYPPILVCSKIDAPDHVFGVSAFGSGAPGCAGEHHFTANSVPKSGNAQFRFLCTRAPANALGLALVSTAKNLGAPDPIGLSIPLHLDLAASELYALDFLSDAWGNADCLAPIPTNPALVGNHYYAQVLWAWPSGSCSPLPSTYGLSTAWGLDLVVQP